VRRTALAFALCAAAAALHAQPLRERVAATLESRGLGRDALGVVGNVLRHEAPPPPATPPLVVELLADPLAAADAAAIFRRAVPTELVELANVGVGRSRESFERLLERYIAELAEARAALAAAVQPFDEAGFVRALSEGVTAERVQAVAEATDRAGLDRAIAQFLRATARFVRELRSPGVRVPDGPRRFDSPIGAVVIGSRGADRHGPDAALIIDPGGDDVYERAPATAGAVSVIIDLAGNDQYGGSDVAVRALSAIVDLAGDDRYAMSGPGLGAAVAGASVLVDLDGDDSYEAPTFAQGAAAFGLGALVERRGNDRYRVQAFGQGYAVSGGLGLLWDQAGNDTYLGEGLPDPYQREGRLGFTQGAASGFRTPLGGGIGILRDDAGDDSYDAQMFAQGAGYYYGLGVLWDGGGNDRYRAVRYAQGSAAHQALGVLRDETGDDRYELAAGVGQGTGQDLAVGVLVDGAGDDRYRTLYDAQGTALANGFGLLADLGGNAQFAAGEGARAWGEARWMRRLPSVGVLLHEPGARFLRGGKSAGPAPYRIEHETEAPPRCPKIAPAPEAAAAPFWTLLAKVSPQLYAEPEPALYGDILRRLIERTAASMAEVPPGNFVLLYTLGEVFPCALAAATPAEAERMWQAIDGMLGSPYLGVIGEALRLHPGPPALMARLRAALDTHRHCALRTLSLATWGSADEARAALGSSCWRLQAAALERLSTLGVAPPADVSLPKFLKPQ
jgi:hypothetical protein